MTYSLFSVRGGLPSAVTLAAALALVACKPSDILSVPPPTGVLSQGDLQGTAGAEAIYDGAEISFLSAVGGSLVEWTELLTDEFTWASFGYGGSSANINARFTASTGGVYTENGDSPLSNLLAARSSLLLAISGLQTYEPASAQWKVGQAYALIGYDELFLAEDYCAGVPLSRDLNGAGAVYGNPLTTDSLLQIAISHFDSALAHASGSDTVRALAQVGLGRALLDEGSYASAAAVADSVSTGFVYNMQFAPASLYTTYESTSLYEGVLLASASYDCSSFNIGDREGVNGLNFISAADPRLVFDTAAGVTCDKAYSFSSALFYYPAKFGSGLNIPLATGVEARLIEAEAALNASQPAQWAADLNALRADSTDTHVVFPDSLLTIAPDSTTGASTAAQQDLMFRERAFWLFGTGTRLGDLRRLIRQYGRNQNTVFPSGPYANGTNPGLPSPLPNYGTDVSLTLPSIGNQNVISTNPDYHGCLTSASKA